MIRLSIADIIIESNIPMKLLHNNMCEFLYKGTRETQVKWNIIYDDSYKIEENPYVIDKNMEIYYVNNKFLFKYMSKMSNVFMVVANETFDTCNFYVTRSLENLEKSNNFILKKTKDELFNIFKLFFSLACLYKGKLPLHSGAVIFDEKGYMFSAPSGSGKTTHVNLWKDVYDSEVLNDDLSLIGVEEGDRTRVVVYGCPWCKQDKEYSNAKVELGGIAFLKKGKENILFDIGKEDVGMMLLESVSSCFLTKNIVDECVKNIVSLAKVCRGYTFNCNKDREAAIKAYNKMVIKE